MAYRCSLSPGSGSGTPAILISFVHICLHLIFVSFGYSCLLSVNLLVTFGFVPPESRDVLEREVFPGQRAHFVVQRVPCLDPLDKVAQIARVAVGSAPRESGCKYPKVTLLVIVLSPFYFFFKLWVIFGFY